MSHYKKSFAALVLLYSVPVAANQTFSRTQILMGDVPVSMTIKASEAKKEKAYRAMEEAFREAVRIENEVSEWKPESQTAFLNRNAGKGWITVGRNLMNILEEARNASILTQGAFDITFSSPDKAARYKDVVFDPELSLASFSKKNMSIKVSGIAKGYIVDSMSEVLKKKGFRNHLINAGDIYASGKWEIAIKNPFAQNDTDTPACNLSVKDAAVSTSGNYERGLHIIDPKTRKPATFFQSVTVVAPKSVTADALATGLFAAGAKDSAPIIAKLIQENHTAMIIVVRNNETKIYRTENSSTIATHCPLRASVPNRN